MAQHRRYPTKKSSKSKLSTLLSLDKSVKQQEIVAPLPLLATDKKGRKINKAPSKSMLDDQPIPWKLRELNQLTQKAKEQQQLAASMANRRKRGKPKNRLLEETQKLGYQHSPWENPKTLIYRVQRDQNKAINEELLKARFGTAGRNVKEIVEEYKALDEKARRRKLQQVAKREKLNKLREKKKQFLESNKQRKRMAIAAGDDQRSEVDEEEENEDAERENGKSNRGEVESTKLEKPPLNNKRKRLGKDDKRRLKRRQEKQHLAKELILNAREVIAFGERVDAPPTFSGEMAQRIRPLYAQAGKKDLLLKQLLVAPNVVQNS